MPHYADNNLTLGTSIHVHVHIHVVSFIDDRYSACYIEVVLYKECPFMKVQHYFPQHLFCRVPHPV